MTSNRHLMVILFGSALLCGSQSFAQQVTTQNTSAQINEAFSDVLRNPASVPVGQKYARLLVESGNFEGGIAALERLLLDPAADPAIRLELSVLYYRVGSYAAAESYARAALADPRLSGEFRKSAEQLLKDLEARNAKGGRFDGTVSTGLRFQTNPTASPESGTQMQSGSRVPVPYASRRQSDLDAFFSANAHHELDLETQNSATLVSNGTLFANRFRRAAHYDTDTAKTDPQDVAVVNANSGIQFQPDPVGMPNLTIRPFVGVGGLLLSGRPYMGSLGGGLEGDLRLNGGATLLGVAYDIRRTSYAQRADISESRAQSGYEQSLEFRMTQEVDALQLVTASVGLRDHNAGRDYFAYEGIDGRVTYALRYADPQFGTGGLWGTSFSVGPSLRRYDGADAAVDRSKTREDVEWRFGATQVFPVSDWGSLMFAVEYTTVDSNLSNYSYNNLTGMSSIIWSF